MILGIFGGPNPTPPPEPQQNQQTEPVAPVEETSASQGAGDASTGSAGEDTGGDQSGPGAQREPAAQPATQTTQTEARLAEQSLVQQARSRSETGPVTAPTASVSAEPQEAQALSESEARAQAEAVRLQSQEAVVMDAIEQAAEGPEMREIGLTRDDADESGFAAAAEAEDQAGAAPSVAEARYMETAGLMAQTSDVSGMDQRA